MDPRELFKKVRRSEKVKEYFFALQVNRSLIKGAIWGIDQGKAKVFSLGGSAAWKNEQELLQAVDQVFTKAAENAGISEQEEPKKVIFGLLASWVKGEKIVPDKLQILKKICQDFDLKPAGFVVTTEAIVKYLRTTEGIPPNVILLRLSQDEVELNLLRLGKIVGSCVVGRSGNLGEDLAEGLARIEDQEVLPARIILYNQGENLSKKQEEILSFPWLAEENKFNFLHLPKTEVSSPNLDIEAVALAGGAEVAKSQGVEAEIFVQKKEEVEEQDQSKEEKKEVLKEDKIGTLEKADLVTDKDLEEKKTSFGFVQDKDIALEGRKEEKKELLSVAFQKQNGKKPAIVKKEITGQKRNYFRPLLGFVKNVPVKLGGYLNQFFSLLALSKKLPLLVLFILFLTIILGGALFWLYWFFPKSEVILYVQPKVLEEEFIVTLDSGVTEVDVENMVIPGEIFQKTVQGSREKETTGTKTIGEKAQGEVVIYNRTLEEKKLPAGSVLTGPKGLKFSLDELVTIASESAGPDYTKIPGKVTAAVTALAIGSEANLASGTEFEVDKYSKLDVVARNETNFSGGSSREIRVVGEKDQQALETALMNELEEKALEELGEKTPPGKKLIEDSLQKEVVDKSFDKKAGQEADSLSINLSVDFKALGYEERLFSDLVAGKISSSVPAGYQFRQDASKFNLELNKMEGNNKAVFSATSKVGLWPVIDTEKIRSNLKGKKPQIGGLYLDGLPNVAGYQVKITPDFIPDKIKTFPRVVENIDVRVEQSAN